MIYKKILNLLFFCKGISLVVSQEEPCLETCGVTTSLTSTVLQKCIDACGDLGHCCGNRLEGETDSSNMQMSCEFGCEIAFYSSDVSECENHCNLGNAAECEYSHPNINSAFQMCGECACGSWPGLQACNDGCNAAAQFDEYYTVPSEEGAFCSGYENIHRALFAGQSNMEGHSEQARAGLFADLVDILNSNMNQADMLQAMEDVLNEAEEAEAHSSTKEALEMYDLKDFMARDTIEGQHSSIVCSFTDPENDSLDCERPVDPTACGLNEFGPELMFAHKFSTTCTEKYGIVKVAKGGTEIEKNWMKVNTSNDDNYWETLVDSIWAAKGTIDVFVWFQGENDSFEDYNKNNYLDNLISFVDDVRNEIYNAASQYLGSESTFSNPSDVPVVIVELGYWIYGDVDPAVVNAQRAFVDQDSNSILVNTGSNDDPAERLSKFFHFEAAAYLIIGSRIADALNSIGYSCRSFEQLDDDSLQEDDSMQDDDSSQEDDDSCCTKTSRQLSLRQIFKF